MVGVDVLKYLQRCNVEILNSVALICFDNFSAATLKDLSFGIYYVYS